MINHKRKILFIDICKTAGTAITKTLQQQFPQDRWEGKHHSVPNYTPRLASRVTDEILDEYSSFTVIRNPYDRMVSLWIWGLGGPYRDVNIPNIVDIDIKPLLNGYPIHQVLLE